MKTNNLTFVSDVSSPVVCPQRMKKWRRDYPHRALALELKVYGVTVEWYEEQQHKQNGLCAICGRPETQKRKGKVKRLSVDHDHATSAARMLLCYRCNTRLAVLEDAEWFIKAQAYLARFKQRDLADDGPEVDIIRAFRRN